MIPTLDSWGDQDRLFSLRGPLRGFVPLRRLRCLIDRFTFSGVIGIIDIPWNGLKRRR